MVGSIERLRTRYGFELRISAIPVIGFLAALGLALVAVSECQSDVLSRSWTQRAALLCYGLFAVSWLLHSWRSMVSRWFLIAAMILGVLLVRRGLNTPGLLVLLFVPTALAAALIGLTAAAVVAVGETLLLVAPASTQRHLPYLQVFSSAVPLLLDARVEKPAVYNGNAQAYLPRVGETLEL